MQLLTHERPRGRAGFIVLGWTGGDAADVQGTPFRCLPVAGAIHNAGHDLVFADQELDLELTDRSAELREALSDVDVVFLWMNELWPSVQTANALELTRLLRSWNPDVRVYVGGAFITICTPAMLSVATPVDGFVRGYGETACPRLLEVLAGDGSLADVPGLVWQDEQGRFHANDVPRETLGPANNAVMYERLDMSGYVQPSGGIFGNGEPAMMIGSGQGCAKGCAFCYWRHHWPSLFGAEQIVAVCERMRDTCGVRQFYLTDLDFMMNLKRPREMAALWRERLPDCRWFALCSPIDAIRLTEDDWRLLAAGGCAKLEFGTESGSPTMLERIGKRHDPELIMEVSRRALSHGIHLMHNMIFGFVDETEQDREQSLALIRALYALDPRRVTFAVRMYQPSPTTPMGDQAIAAVEGFPETIVDLLDYRVGYAADGQRMMPWLSPAAERAVKEWVGFYLPLATSDLPVDGPVLRPLYRAMRRVAWWRMRTGFRGLRLERTLARGWLGRQAFTQTYRP